MAGRKLSKDAFVRAVKSVVEQSYTGERHCYTVLVAGVDNIVVTDRATGLCDIFNTASVRSFDIVTEGEECV